MNCHIFVSARSGRRLLFRVNEYTSVVKASCGPRGFILTTRTGAEFRVTTTHPVVIVDTTPAPVARAA